MFAQSNNLNTKISVSFQNNSFQEVFNELSEKSGCNFSFNAQLVPLEETISFKANDQSLLYILTNLLGEYNLSFKELNNQIIIYPAVKTPNTNNSKKQKTRDDKSEYTELALPTTYTDTVYETILDTNKIYDTINVYVYDTVKVFDTIKIEKENPVEIPNRKPKYPVYSIQLDYGYAKNSMILKNNSAEKDFYENFKAGFSSGNSIQLNTSFLIEYENFLVHTGVGYSLIKNNWYSKEQIKGGYLTLDTISRYYTGISNEDTAWVYITRDKWIETLTISEKQTSSKYHYLTIPMLVGYKVTFKKNTFELKTGIISNIFLTANGNEVIGKDSIVFEDVKTNKNIFSAFNMSGYLSLTFNYMVNDDFYLFVGPFYQRSLWSIYDKKYWRSQHIGSTGIKFGIQKKL